MDYGGPHLLNTFFPCAVNCCTTRSSCNHEAVIACAFLVNPFSDFDLKFCVDVPHIKKKYLPGAPFFFFSGGVASLSISRKTPMAFW